MISTVLLCSTGCQPYAISPVDYSTAPPHTPVDYTGEGDGRREFVELVKATKVGDRFSDFAAQVSVRLVNSTDHADDFSIRTYDWGTWGRPALVIVAVQDDIIIAIDRGGISSP